jgi:hypothetical protein
MLFVKRRESLAALQKYHSEDGMYVRTLKILPLNTPITMQIVVNDNTISLEAVVRCTMDSAREHSENLAWGSGSSGSYTRTKNYSGSSSWKM